MFASKHSRATRTMNMTAVLVICSILLVAPDVLSGEPFVAEEIAVLRASGQHRDALERARAWLARNEASAGTPAVQIADARLVVATLENALRWPASRLAKLTEADSLLLAVQALYEEGRFAEVCAASKREISLRLAIQGTGHPECAVAYTQEGYGLLELRRYGDAEDRARKALSILRTTLGEVHPRYTDSLTLLAFVLDARGDWIGYESILRRVLALDLKSCGPVSEEVGTDLTNLADLMFRQGEPVAAYEFNRDALAVRLALAGTSADHDGSVAQALNNLGAACISAGRAAEADSCLQAAIRIYKRLLPDTLIDLARCYGNLGTLAQSEDDLVRAELSYRRAIGLMLEASSGDSTAAAHQLSNLANACRLQGRFDAAVDLYDRVLSLDIRSGGLEHPTVAGTLLKRGLARFEIDDREGGKADLQRSAQVFEAARVRAGAEMKRSTFLESPYPYLAVAHLADGEALEAWTATEMGLARVLSEMVTEPQARTGDSARQALGDSLRRAESQARERLSLAERTGTETGSDGRAAARADLALAEAALTAFQQDLVRDRPLRSGISWSLSDLQKQLGAKTAMIGWLDVPLVRGRQIWGYVIRQAGPVSWVRLEPSAPGTTLRPGSRSVGAAATALGSALIEPTGDTESTLALAQQCAAACLWPMLASFGDVTDLIVVPTGPLASIPLESLQDDRGRWLGDRYSISYVPSATILAWLGEGQSTSHGSVVAGTAPEQTLLLGDPPFSAAQKDAMLREANAPPHGIRSTRLSKESLLAALAHRGAGGVEWPRLAYTRDEVRAIAQVAPGVTLLLGPQASEPELARLADSGELSRFNVLHLATHAVIDAERPERSCLILAQTDLPDFAEAVATGVRPYDGRLTAFAIANEWRLDADLVTLSACETALGRDVSGEGTVGFAHAFMQAGARSLIVSVWKVDDRATAMLMQRFYENLWGRSGASGRDANWLRRLAGRLSGRSAQSKVEALREAKRWLREYRENGVQPYAHPYFWSGFILIGDRS